MFIILIYRLQPQENFKNRYSQQKTDSALHSIPHFHCLLTVKFHDLKKEEIQ